MSTKIRTYISIALIGLFIILVATVVAASYYRYVVLEDFLVYAQVSCDPDSESCFVYECAPEDGCDPEEPYYFYKVIYKDAAAIEACDPWSEDGCQELTCEAGEACEIVECSLENMASYQELDYCG